MSIGKGVFKTMAFDKMIVKKLLKKFDDVLFVVKFPDGEEFKVGEGEPQAIMIWVQ